MPTDPYVSTPLDEKPRQEQNLPPGMHLPPARSWRANRPGDVDPEWPEGLLLGSPGPNVGHAVKLAHDAARTMELSAHEPLEDAIAVTADLAMRRASLAGRAPVPADVEVALAILGYDGSADPEFARWRAVTVAHAGEDYPTRRALVDAVSDELLLLDPDHLADRVAEERRTMRPTVA